MNAALEFKNRSTDSIVSENIHSESSGYVYRSLSWLDYAQRKQCATALQYSAHDLRQGIEHLLFEELILSTGFKLTEAEYKGCLGNSTKLRSIIRRISPLRKKLSEFVNVVIATSNENIETAIWDHELLIKYWGVSSEYLHWGGDV